MKNLCLPPDPAHHLLRLTALTPANCGSSHGSAAVDHPVAVDAWHELPYLPGSAIKGVLAGRRGNVWAGENVLNEERTAIYGTPDREGRGDGQPSRVIFGDGEPLAFPLLLADGQRVFVVLAETVYRLARWGFLPAAGLRPVESELACESVSLASPALLPPLSQPLSSAAFGLGPGLLRRLTGLGEAPFLVAAPRAARALWLAALEERTQTALEDDRRVRRGSLRTLELIPAGALFVSVVSNAHSRPVDLGPASFVQLGAWENCGLGYFHLEHLDEAAVAQEEAEPAAPRPDRVGTGGRRADHELMAEIFAAVGGLVGKKEAGTARSAIYDLGPRLAQQGFHATLAFCLAKAGGARPGAQADELKKEQLAYRFVLARLFQAKEDPFPELHRRVVEAMTRDRLPADFEPTRLWLRRYAEILLPREQGNG